MPNVPPQEPSVGSPDRYAVRVLRIENGQSFFVRALSVRYGGLFTHFVRGRSRYCPGEGCSPADHKTQRFWKGYASVDIWNDVAQLWYPTVLEITESLELDFRDVWQRGQVWQVERGKKAGKKQPIVTGTLLETQPANKIPPAVDYTGVLIHLYHVEHLDLTKRNPLPKRLFSEPVPGQGPTCLDVPAAPPPGPRPSLVEALKALRNGR